MVSDSVVSAAGRTAIWEVMMEVSILVLMVIATTAVVGLHSRA